MNTIGHSDSIRPTSETPRSLEAMTSVAPILASEVISSSGMDDEPNRMAPSISISPIAPQAPRETSLSGDRNELDRQ